MLVNVASSMIKDQHYCHTKLETPVGKMFCLASDDGISNLIFENNEEEQEQILSTLTIVEEDNRHLIQLKRELQAYFEGSLKSFTVHLDLKGTPFHKKVWKELVHIPYGATKTYGEMATEMGDLKKIRAVANANAKNPVMILIPCHRVIGAGNKLTGYRGGLERKRWLLNFEKEHSNSSFKTTLF